MLNKVILMGRLVKDVEYKTSQSGVSFSRFTVAVSRDFLSQDKERKSDFINVVAWRRNADFVSKYFVKGNLIALVGRIETRTWDTSDGTKRYSTEVIAENFYFCGDKNGGAQPNDYSNSYGEQNSENFEANFLSSFKPHSLNEDSQEQNIDFSDIDTDDDLPF